MKEIIKKHTTAMTITLVLVVSVLLVLPNMYLWDPGLDWFVGPGTIVNDGMGNKIDYMHIQSERTKFDSDERICLSASYALTPHRLKVESIYMDVACTQYIDVTLSCGELIQYPKENFNSENWFHFYPGPEDTVYKTEIKEFDIVTLYAKKTGIFKRVKKESLGNPFEITLKVKPDAPKTFLGSLYVHVTLDEDTGGGGAFCEIFIYKNGDRIYLSEKSVEDAMARGRIIP